MMRFSSRKKLASAISAVLLTAAIAQPTLAQPSEQSEEEHYEFSMAPPLQENNDSLATDQEQRIRSVNPADFTTPVHPIEIPKEPPIEIPATDNAPGFGIAHIQIILSDHQVPELEVFINGKKIGWISPESGDVYYRGNKVGKVSRNGDGKTGYTYDNGNNSVTFYVSDNGIVTINKDSAQIDTGWGINAPAIDPAHPIEIDDVSMDKELRISLNEDNHIVINDHTTRLTANHEDGMIYGKNGDQLAKFEADGDRIKITTERHEFYVDNGTLVTPKPWAIKNSLNQQQKSQMRIKAHNLRERIKQQFKRS